MSTAKIRFGMLLGLIAVCGSVVAFAARPSVFSSNAKTKIHWRADLEQAHEEALKSNKPMLIVFDAEWCSFCKKMDQATFSDPAIITYVNNTFVPVQLSLEDNYRTAEILEVDRIPASVALSPNADLLGRIVGFVNAETYRESLSKIRVLNQRVIVEKPKLPARAR